MFSMKVAIRLSATDPTSSLIFHAVTPKLLDKRPNTYTYAKALAENLLVEEASNLPVIVVRPSIIGAVWRDGLPGWTDNVNGPTGIFVAVCESPDE